MNPQLAEIAAAVAPGAHAVLLVDQAGAGTPIGHSAATDNEASAVHGRTCASRASTLEGTAA